MAAKHGPANGCLKTLSASDLHFNFHLLKAVQVEVNV